jgi:hypothetical protein
VTVVVGNEIKGLVYWLFEMKGLVYWLLVASPLPGASL